MAKFDGKQIIGVVGNLVFKKGRKGKTTIVQTKPQHVKQTANTKVTANLFGKGSTLGKAIRYDLYELTGDFYDGGAINRMNKLNREILEQCYNKDTKEFTFNQNSFSRLAGFEFNEESPLSKSLWADPQVDLNGNQFTLSLPTFEIPEQLKFPAGSNTCEITVAIAFYNLEQGLRKPAKQQILEVSTKEPHVPAHNFTFEVPDGCLCIIGIRLNYYSLYNNIKTVKNNQKFNPAALCGAVITPGVFVIPPSNNTPNKVISPEWVYVNNLKFCNKNK